jgi:hypothetical protein
MLEYKGHVSLSRITNGEFRQKYVNFDVKMPQIIESQLSLDLKRIITIMKLAQIRTLAIDDWNGAFNGPLYKSSYKPLEYGVEMPLAGRWVDAAISINPNRVRRNIKSDFGEIAYSREDFRADGWAHNLSQSISYGIRDIAREHLLHDVSLQENIFRSAIGLFSLYVAFDANEVWIAPFVAGGVSQMMNLLHKSMYKKWAQEGYSNYLFYSTPVFRVAWLELTASRRGLVTVK